MADIAEIYRAARLRKILLFLFSVAGVILFTGLLSVSVSDNITLSEAYRLIWGHITGVEYPLRSADWWNDRYIWNYSIPSAIGAIIAGAGLAAAGTLMQGILNNPLADPYSTGISSGACLGAVCAIIVGVSLSGGTSEVSIVINAFIGAMVPALIIIVISNRIVLTPATLILMGTAISYFFNSMITFLMVTTDVDKLHTAYIWQIGSLDMISWTNLPIMAAISCVGIVIVMLLSRKLNLLSLGDNSAKSLGLDVESFRTLCLMIMALMTAGIVSFTGILGFIGLVTPHIVRLIIGSDNRFVCPIAMAFSAFLLLAADYLSTAVFNTQVGVIVAMIGSPIFFLLIVLQKKGREIY